MKLYIPTCILNFNNIFTTESISPASFYEKRGFGNKRYYKVEANNLDNNIILYSKYPYFTVDNSEVANYPMVIEIETNDYKDIFKELSEKEGVKIYSSSSTIYLNHFNCVVYFQNQDELTYTSIQAEPSLEIKYREIYKLKVREEKENTFQWDKSFLENLSDTELNNESLEKDRFIDKIKGLIFCYLIGKSIFSTNEDEDIIKLQNLEKEIETILSDIRKKKKPSDIQKGRLDKLIKEFVLIIKLSQAQRNVNSLNELISAIKNDKLNAREIMEKMIEEAEIYFDAKNELNALLEILKTKTKKAEKIKEQENRYNAFLNGFSTSIQKFIEYNNCFANLRETFGIKEGNLISIKSNTKTNYYESLLNMLIKNEYRTELNGEQLKKEVGIAVSGGEKLKEFYNNTRKEEQPSWEDSDYSKYINPLINNLKNSSSFEISNTNHPALKALAAFCKKGNDDIDTLINYMQENDFVDYKFALSLYGADKGFATLPKTFTNSLINKSSVYDKFFKDLQNLLFKFDNLGTYNKQETKEVENQKEENKIKLEQKIEENLQVKTVEISSTNSPKSLLKNRDWINYCIEHFISADSKDKTKIKKQFQTDMDWFIDNHNEKYNDKNKGETEGIYHKKEKSNNAVLDRLEKYMNNKTNPKEDKGFQHWLKEIYSKNIKIDEIINYLRKEYVI